MKLVTVNGIKCVLVERDETVEALRKFCDKSALIFGGTSPTIEVEEMPNIIMGGGHAANYQAVNAFIAAMSGDDEDDGGM